METKVGFAWCDNQHPDILFEPAQGLFLGAIHYHFLGYTIALKQQWERIVSITPQFHWVRPGPMESGRVYLWARSVIPVFRIPEDFFFPVFSGGFFSQECGFGEAAGIPVFSAVTGAWSQKFLWDRNSCIYPRFLRIPPDSSGYLVRLMKAFC